MRTFRSCVTPDGQFVYGIHKPNYTVTNMRATTNVITLGCMEDGPKVDNSRNYPEQNVKVENADWIFEIHNPFPFKGATFIDKEWADASAENYKRIRIAPPEQVSMTAVLQDTGTSPSLFSRLPEPVLLSLATCSTDPEDLIQLAHLSCSFEIDENGQPSGLVYTTRANGSVRPLIAKHLLFEAVANNPHLPDVYKIAMVIRPGAQGGSEIVGEWPQDGESHVYEYLRRNSYIAGGHYAANMAEDSIRYSVSDLKNSDMKGLRHLYYQRTYIRLAEELAIDLPQKPCVLSASELESLRQEVLSKITSGAQTTTATLWGWNFGFDYAPSRYRLHASHQQVHQQYSMIPDSVSGYSGSLESSHAEIPAYGCGDLISDVIDHYKEATGNSFFTDYRNAIKSNRRMDGRADLESSLIVWQDENVILFVPKAQTSQWELQLMTLPDTNGWLVGNIVEANSSTRHSLDRGILTAQKVLAGLGAKMVTSIEYPKRLRAAARQDQPLLYAFLPRLPESPGAFSEAQLRFINGHYPEDFAAVCREQIKK
ncbi:hypothetical protein [Desulfopila sp. IMCC35008]|uniref:hypothetical protein n=1 Tax=Desulfopila sp. IMCC35008 TaxID=2653858 RepID=UPI0013D1A71F|nr:hypothetical protein [Desulfopila sp. IMCC35008]